MEIFSFHSFIESLQLNLLEIHMRISNNTRHTRITHNHEVEKILCRKLKLMNILSTTFSHSSELRVGKENRGEKFIIMMMSADDERSHQEV